MPNLWNVAICAFTLFFSLLLLPVLSSIFMPSDGTEDNAKKRNVKKKCHINFVCMRVFMNTSVKYWQMPGINKPNTNRFLWRYALQSNNVNSILHVFSLLSFPFWLRFVLLFFLLRCRILSIFFFLAPFFPSSKLLHNLLNVAKGKSSNGRAKWNRVEYSKSIFQFDPLCLLLCTALRGVAQPNLRQHHQPVFFSLWIIITLFIPSTKITFATNFCEERNSTRKCQSQIAFDMADVETREPIKLPCTKNTEKNPFFKSAS